MMKKYKLIKTYPNCPKLGTIWDWQEKFDISEYPEYWEEVYFEILKYSDGVSNYYLRPNGSYREINTRNECNEKYLLNHQYKIISVKRLADNQVFTVGDKINYSIGISDKINIEIIEGFNLVQKDEKLSTDKIGVYFKDMNNYQANLMNLKPMKVLFSTEDNYNIYEGDEYYIVFYLNKCKYFKYKSNVEKFVAENKLPIEKLLYFDPRINKSCDKVLYFTANGKEMYSVNETNMKENKINMKIIGIKWNGKIEDITHIGEKTGTKYKYNRDEIVEKIVEVNQTIYDIYYNKKGKKTVLRVFNPIEVEYEIE